MAFKNGCDMHSPLDQCEFVVLRVAIETAETAVGFLAAPDSGTVRDCLTTVGADIQIPQFEEVLAFRFIHFGSRQAQSQIAE
jgi:hypothetical protein